MVAVVATTDTFTPSIRTRVPWEEYRRIPGVSITRLKELARSPKHYRYRLTHPKESDAMTLGSAVHVAVLEPERFDTDHAVWGERTESGRGRPRTGKDYEAFRATNAGRRILTPDEHASAIAIRDAVRGEPNAMAYLESGDPEVTMQWLTPEGVQFKGRLDWLTYDHDGEPVLVGLKTSRDCRPIPFGNQAARLGYEKQWAAYFDGYAASSGRPAARVVEIVVESTPPFDVGVYVVPADVIDFGREQYRKLLDVLGACEATGVWPGAVPEETSVSLPTWAYPTDSDVSDLGLEGFSNE